MTLLFVVVFSGTANTEIYKYWNTHSLHDALPRSVPIEKTIRHPGQMADVIVDELRRLQILLPSASILEAVLRRARQQAEQLTYEVLTNGLLPDTLQDRKSTRLNSSH